MGVNGNVFLEACDRAHAYAIDFLKNEATLMGAPYPRIGVTRPPLVDDRYLALHAFAERYGFLVMQILRSDFPPGFASWLDPSATTPFFPRGTIYLCVEQMKAWAVSPPGNESVGILHQANRSILHEIGHSFLNVQKHPDVIFEGQYESDGEEEESAWLFAFTFLAILAGDYSRTKRETGIDDVVRCVL